MTDDLTRRLASNLDRAFPALVDAHGPLVLSILARLGDGATAEDLCQDVFLRAYTALKGYDSSRIAELDVRPWLATITRNLLRNEYRRLARKSTVPLSRCAGEQPRSDLGQPESSVVDRDSAEQLDELLRQLPSKQRQTVVLRYVAGLTTRETAAAMGCPEGTVKSDLSRGLARLRVLLAGSIDKEEGS